ncbi:MAG: VanW family protein [Clostridiales bacterium]
MSFNSIKSFLQLKNKKNVNLICYSLLSFLGIMLLISIFLSLNYQKTYSGIKVNDLDVGNKSKSELNVILEENFTENKKNTFLTINAKDTVKKIDFEELEVKYDIDKISNKIFSIGHSGNIFINIFNIFNTGLFGSDIKFEISYNEKVLNKILDEISKEVAIPVKEAYIEELNKEVYLVAGENGSNINPKKALTRISKILNEGTNSSIKLKIEKTKPKKINLDNFHKLLNITSKNATIDIINRRDYKIISEVNGKKIDKKTLKKYITKLNTTKSEKIKLPVKLELPDITEANIKKNLFKDKLSNFETIYPAYSQEKIDRAQNIKLATSKINNIIIEPGGIFSFNETVGKRTIDQGYKSATAFMNGEMVQSIGGGICQVSTTLHNAILLADLVFTERKNHTFKVGYVEPGMDAAVSYGSLDYKFKNTSNWPIKIIGKTTPKNQLIFEILGTNEKPDKVVSYASQIVNYISPSIKYTDDPSLKEGEIKIIKNGFSGMVVDTYKKITINGVVTENKLLYGSYYNAYDSKALRGTKK